MAGVTVTVTVSGGWAGVRDLMDMVNDELDDEYEWQVQHEAGACAPCRANSDPTLIPFPGCRGEERHAKAHGYGCRCQRVLKRKHSQND